MGTMVEDRYRRPSNCLYAKGNGRIALVRDGLAGCHELDQVSGLYAAVRKDGLLQKKQAATYRAGHTV